MGGGLCHNVKDPPMFRTAASAALPIAALLCSGIAHAAEPAAIPLAAVASLPTDRDRALKCMTLAIAYESGFEPRAGQIAVGEVIVNRTRHRAYPKSVCGVVFQGSQRRTGCQFTFTCDGALRRPLPPRVMASARQVAAEVLAGASSGLVGGATHYHASYVSPYWAPSLVRLGVIGQHVFYRGAGGIGPRARIAAGVESAVPATPAPQRATFSPWGLAVAAR